MPTQEDDEDQPLLRPYSHYDEEASGFELSTPLDERTRQRAVRLLPVVVVVYFVSYIVCHVEVDPYIYNKISQEYNNSQTSETPCTDHSSSNTSDGQKIQNEIEERAATLEMYLGFTTFLVAVLPVVVLGPLTDTMGRKIGFLMPVTGTFLKEVVYVFIVGFDLPLGFLFLAHVLEAIGGSFAAMLTTMFSVISDVTLPGRKRASFITIMEATQTVMASITQIAVAAWMRTTSSFQQPLYLALATGIVSLAMALCFPETHQGLAPAGVRVNSWRHRGRECWAFLRGCFCLAKRSFALYIRDDRGRLPRRRLCFAVFVLTVAVNFSRSGPWGLLLMKYPLCWAATSVVIFNSVQMVVGWLVIFLAIDLFRSVFKMADRHIALIGCLSSALSLSFTPVAGNDTMVYEVAFLGLFVRATIPMLRSMLSSSVDQHNQGALYSSLGVVETLGAGVFGLCSTKLYAATLDSFPGAVFVLFAGLMVCAIVLLIGLQILHNRNGLRESYEQNNTVQTLD